MHWGEPEILWLLALVPVLGWMGWGTLRWRRRAAQSIGDPRVLARLYPAGVARWRLRRLFLMLAGATLLILAAARPQYGKIEQNFKTFGTSAMVALDCSPSMSGKDVQPNRLEAAKNCLRGFLETMAGNQVGIIAFSGKAYLQCPMTVDTKLAETILDSIDFESVQLAGTDIGGAIEVALKSFENAGGQPAARTLVLITDGEDNEGAGVEMARKAAAAHVRIYAIGIGTERGSPVTDANGEFINNEAGMKVRSSLQMGTLEQIASITGGKAWRAGGSYGIAVRALVDEVARQGKVQLEEEKKVVYQDRFQWFLFPALVLLMLSVVLMPERTTPTGPAYGARDAEEARI